MSAAGPASHDPGTHIPGCREIRPDVAHDRRGSFVKVLHEGLLAQLPSDFAVTEIFWTVSHRDVVRGLHFQSPPAAVAKLVWCSAGRAFDVVVDLRRGSPTFGACATFVLDAALGNAVFVPIGLAHGFCALEDDTTIVYAQSGGFSAEHDLGVHWQSVDVQWPVTPEHAVLSDRDLRHPTLAEYDSPFEFDPATSGGWFES